MAARVFGLNSCLCLFFVTGFRDHALQWDETNHLNGGVLLLRSHFRYYVKSSMFYPPLWKKLEEQEQSAIRFNLYNRRIVSSKLQSTHQSLNIYNKQTQQNRPRNSKHRNQQ